ncbi:MAG: VTT domain-containing protein [Acidobacteriota bacterium]|nr:VTT domain-containing protein [Acidobacteriota bacterium]
MSLAAALPAPVPELYAAAAALLAAPHQPGHLVHLLLSFGLAGLFLVSIVDSSFVPLPVPGVTDLLIVVMAAQHANLFLLVGLATAGSALGGFLSYKVGHSGGLAFVEKHVPKRIFRRVTRWMETHAILSVALPAVLPPPMPLSPFVLAAGALNMSQKKFLSAFTISRAVRHAAAAAIGIHWGPSVLHLWNMFTRKYAVPILSTIWGAILISVGVALYKLWRISQSMKREDAQRARKDPSARPVEAA